MNAIVEFIMKHGYAVLFGALLAHAKRTPPANGTARRPDWNGRILPAVVLMIAALLLFIEHHLRGLHSVLPR